MNDGMPELDRMEPDVRPPRGSPTGPGGRRLQPARRPRRNGLGIAALAISIMALIAAVIALVLALRDTASPEPPEDPEPEEVVTFQFGGRTMTPLEGMTLNPYDRAAFGLDGKGRVTYEKDGRKARTGIDVSSFQGDIDWQAVSEDGIGFAIIRLGRRGYTEGALFEDDNFRQNLQGALDAGLDVGVYFFSQAVTPEEAEEEADFVLAALDGQELALPMTFDWEPVRQEDSRTNDMSGEDATRYAVAFCERIGDAGYRPAVYFNQTQGYLGYDLRELETYDLWLAEYDSVPDFYYHFNLWQYSESGQVDGIEGDVDLDLAF